MELAATVTQRKPGEVAEEWQVVQYDSRSLTETEKWYRQIESEALTGDLGVENSTYSCMESRLRS